MKLENQVVSLEFAKELKEAGYKQEGLWWWVTYTKHAPEKLRDNPKVLLYKTTSSYKFNEGKIIDSGIVKYFVAPTVAELGEKLKKYSNDIKYKLPYWLENRHLQKGKYWYSVLSIKGISYMISEYTEANARAKMWLYLKKKRLI